MDLANPYEMKSLCRSTGVLAQISFPLNTSRRVLHNFRLRDCPEWRLPIRVCACGGGVHLKISRGRPARAAPPATCTTPLPSTWLGGCQNNTAPDDPCGSGKA